MTFAFGPGSEANLVGVHPKLVEVTRRALQHSAQDFSVVDGVRTHEEQVENVRRGVSQTLDSKHLKQADGFGHAVDLVPFFRGAPRWEWSLIWAVALAMQQAARELSVNLTWGGVWDRPLYGLGPLEPAVADYVDRRKALYPKKTVFIDGPHYELRP